MPFRFDHKKAIHVILFVLHSLGKYVEPSKLFVILYLADIKHLGRHGVFITGDTYIAMKYGPAPLNILGIYQQLKEEKAQKDHYDKAKEYIGINDACQLFALSSYNAFYLSGSEVECLFETMHQYKSMPV